MKKNDAKMRFLTTVGAFLFWILVWFIAAILVDYDLVLPYPHTVLATLLSMLGTWHFWIASLLSLLRVFLGFLLGGLVGILLAVSAHLLQSVEAVFSPLITVIRSTPVASFIMLLLVLMERESIPIFISILMVTPIVYTNVRTGLAKVDQGLLEVARVYNFSITKQIRKLYIPSVLPYLIAAARTALGLAWKAGIAAEVLCTTKNSIGNEIYLSKIYLGTTDELFAWTAVVIILSLLLEKGMLWLVKRLDKRFRHTTATEERT